MTYPSLYQNSRSISRFYRNNSKPHKDVIGIYRPSNLENIGFHFDHVRALWFYHLIRFGYFDMETAKNIFSVVSPDKKFPSSWFYSVVGNRNYPLSTYREFFKKEVWQECDTSKKRNHRRKVYYVNKRFVLWYMSEFEQYSKLRELIKVTEYENSMYSLSVNRLLGGKPTSIIVHDLNIRLIVSMIANHITQTTLGSVSTEELNLQFAFPVDKLRISVVPDAAIFIKSHVYHLEYDRTNEHHKRLLGKVIGYAEEKYYRGTSVFFIFESHIQRKRLQTRIQNFMTNIVSFRYREDKLLTECLRENQVSVFVSNIFQSVEQISKTIMQENHLVEHPEITAEYLNSDFRVADRVIDVTKSEIPDFSYMVTLQDDLFDLESIPIVFVPYLEADINIRLEELYQQYKEEYSKIFLAFDKSIKTNVFVPVRNNYFQTIYV